MSYFVGQPPMVVQRARAWLGRLVAGDQRPRIEAVAGPYRGGDVDGLNKTWQPDAYSPDRAVGEGWDLLTRRVLDLARNDPAAIAPRRWPCDSG